MASVFHHWMATAAPAGGTVSVLNDRAQISPCLSWHVSFSFLLFVFMPFMSYEWYVLVMEAMNTDTDTEYGIEQYPSESVLFIPQLSLAFSFFTLQVIRL